MLRTKQWLLQIKHLGSCSISAEMMMVCFQTCLKKNTVWGGGGHTSTFCSHTHIFFFSFFIEINLLNPTFRCLQERKRLNLLHLCNKASIKPAKKHIYPVACMHIAKIKGVNRSVTTNRPAILRHIQFFTIMLSCCNVIALLSII